MDTRWGRQLTTGGFSPTRLVRVRTLLERHIDTGFVPGVVAILARRGEVHVEALGTLAFAGDGSATAMAGDTICRLGSMTKPIVAACAMTLVEDGTLRLDDPVDDLLPELANMDVLADPRGPLADTAPANRPITLRDLLTLTPGTGSVIAEPGTVPIADALNAIGQAAPDEWMRQLGALPLVHQPGERWMYHTSSDVTGVLIARATGTSVDAALRERICEPLGMTDTAFHVGADRLARLATAYERDNAATGDPVVDDGPNGYWSRPPVFESGGGGLVSTANDWLAFASALRSGGTYRGERVLSRPAVTLMTSDHLTPEQKVAGGFWTPGYFDTLGWGFGMSVCTRRTHLGPSVGTYGWPGFYGTVWYNDPAEDLISIVMLQRAHAGNQSQPMWLDFWNAVYQAIED